MSPRERPKARSSALKRVVTTVVALATSSLLVSCGGASDGASRDADTANHATGTATPESTASASALPAIEDIVKAGGARLEVPAPARP